MKKNVIWIFNQYAGAPQYGMGFRSYYLAREFVKQGNDVYVFSASSSHLFRSAPQTRGCYTYENIDGIKYVWVKVAAYSQSKSIKRIFVMVSFFLRLYEIGRLKLSIPKAVIVSSASPFPLLPAMYFKKKYKIPLIFEVRDIWPLSLIDLGNYSRLHPFIILLQMLENAAYKLSDVVVSVLPYALEHMIKHGLDERKYYYIPNGFSLMQKPSQTKDKHNIMNFPEDAFIIGYTGTLGIANAMDYFIEAANMLRQHSQIYFLLVGDGDHKEKLQSLSANPNIVFINAVPVTEVYHYIEKCDVMYHGCLNKKIYEYGLSPNKIFDYMLCKKTIVHAVSTRHNIIADADCGFTVPSENSTCLADVFLSVSQLPREELMRMGQNGYDYVLKNHSYSALADKYIKILEDLWTR